MTADLRALIEAVEAGTATGGYAALVVSRATPPLIAAVIGDDNEMWSAFSAAHDGSLDGAAYVVEHLLPECIWDLDSDGFAKVRPWDSDDLVYTGLAPDNPARALLLAALRAKLGEGE